MADLISRAAAIARIDNCVVLSGIGLEPVMAVRDIKALISVLPAVAAVAVVRCRDCKHRDPEDKKCDCGHDIMWQLPRDDDWFCADAKRRGE